MALSTRSGRSGNVCLSVRIAPGSTDANAKHDDRSPPVTGSAINTGRAIKTGRTINTGWAIDTGPAINTGGAIIVPTAVVVPIAPSSVVVRLGRGSQQGKR
jgi:hypothetical protein